MSGSHDRATPADEGMHLVLYDGVCGLCNRLVQFILRHDRRATFFLAPLQSVTGRAAVERSGASPDDLTTFYVVTNHRSDRARLLGRSRAALFVARELGWPWKAAAMLRILPQALLDAIYDVVARTRYRVFGRSDRCMIPPPDFRRRFIDQ